MDGGKKKRTRRLADLIVDSGSGIPWDQLTAEEMVGLEMNQMRMRLRRVFDQSLAHSLAEGGGDVPLAVVLAACDDMETAKQLAFAINSARQAAISGF